MWRRKCIHKHLSELHRYRQTAFHCMLQSDNLKNFVSLAPMSSKPCWWAAKLFEQVLRWKTIFQPLFCDQSIVFTALVPSHIIENSTIAPHYRPNPLYTQWTRTFVKPLAGCLARSFSTMSGFILSSPWMNMNVDLVSGYRRSLGFELPLITFKKPVQLTYCFIEHAICLYV